MRSLFSSLHLQLNVFEGPLDVLVHLIHRKEVQSKAVSLGELFTTLGKELVDFEIASHFLEQFTLLMLFKSRDLFPYEEDKQGFDLAPPQDAIIHLSEYYKVKEIATRLDQRQEEEACRYLRGTQEEIVLPPPGLEQISIEQLQKLFQKVLERLPKTHTIKKDRYTVQDGKSLLRNGLTQGSFNLFDFLTKIEERGLLIVTFLAILELMKEGTLFVNGEYQVEAREVL